MPAVPPPRGPARATTAALLPLGLLALGLLAGGTAGCRSLGAAADVVDRSDLVSDLAAQLDRSAELTYTADYQLPGGATATIAQAQRPRRAAYVFPGGTLTITAQASTRCSTAPKVACTVAAPPVPDARPAPTLTTADGRRAMVTPAEIAALLEASALDADASVQQHDTTVAGHHASCVDVRRAASPGTSRFVACVTADGVLGSFRGTLGGQPVEVAMTRYRDTVAPTAFDPPRGATVVDRRSR